MQRYGVLNRDKMNYFITVLKSVITSFFSSFVAFFHNHPPLFILFFFRGKEAKKQKKKPKNVLSSWAARQVLGRLK